MLLSLCHWTVIPGPCDVLYFFFNDTAPTEIYTLSLHDALPIFPMAARRRRSTTPGSRRSWRKRCRRSEEHTSELQSPDHLVCRLLLEKKKKKENNQKTSARTRVQPTRRLLRLARSAHTHTLIAV